MAANNFPFQVPQRRPPPLPPKIVPETIFELPADPIGMKDGSFEMATEEFDEHLQQAYVGNENQNVRDVPDDHFESIDDALERPLPPLP